jgi:hypothetical protein
MEPKIREEPRFTPPARRSLGSQWPSMILYIIVGYPWIRFSERTFGGTSSPFEDMALLLYLGLPPALIVGACTYAFMLLKARLESGRPPPGHTESRPPDTGCTSH